MKSIKQIAESIGISKQRVYRFIRANDIKDVNGVLPCDKNSRHEKLFFDDVAETRINAYFKTATVSLDDAKLYHHETVLHQLETVVEMMKTELEFKNQQISELSNALQQAQALHAMDIKALTDKEEKPQGFFSRIFRRNS
jgi:predicted transcriptional regulator YheO